MTGLFADQNNQMEEKYLLAVLTKVINLNAAKLSQICKFYPNIDTACKDDFFEIKKISKPKWISKWDKNKHTIQDNIQKLQDDLKKNNIKLITHTSDQYPKTLKSLENYPLALFAKGDISQLNKTTMLTVVGSRKVDIYAKILMENILSPACKLGVGVVSGLAIGIDAISHNIANQHNTTNIGVIGSGLDKKSFYPSQNWLLANQIIEKGGTVISEYLPGSLPTIYTFPQRNRILAALTDLTWVVQASQKSGSLITALVARELGKTIATTPADIRNKDYDGNLKLLKEGCNIISDYEDIMQLLNLKIHPEININTKIEFASKEEEKIYKKLSIQPQSIESLSNQVRMSVAEISTYLTMMELSGIAINTGENNWIKS